MADIATDDEGVWLTYAEAADRLGVKPDSVKRRAMNRRWRRESGNDGRTRVLIPHDVLDDITDDTGDDNSGDIIAEFTPDIEIVAQLAEAHAEIIGLKAQLERADREIERTRDDAEKRISEIRDILDHERTRSAQDLERVEAQASARISDKDTQIDRLERRLDNALAPQPSLFERISGRIRG